MSCAEVIHLFGRHKVSMMSAVTSLWTNAVAAAAQ